MEHNNKKIYLFYFVFLTFLLIGFFVSSVFFKNLYTEFLYQIALTGTLCFVSGSLVLSTLWAPGTKKYKILRSLASITFPFSCLDLIFKTFKINVLPQLLVEIIIIATGLTFIITYLTSVVEAVKIKKLLTLLTAAPTLVKQERNYLPFLLTVLVLVIFTSLLLINPNNIFSAKIQFICGSLGIFLSLFAAIFFAIVAAAEIYKAGTNK